MTESKSAEPELRHKRIGLVACDAIESALGRALQQAEASFAKVDAQAMAPGAAELERYDALILGVTEAAGSDWFRPDLLRANTRPLLLAGRWEEIHARISLQAHADEVIFAPFAARELIFRLGRMTAGAAEGRHRAGARRGKPCVVVADDDRDIVTYLKTVLGHLDADAHTVSDGKSALAAARRLLPDLLLLDVSMPLMNGIDVLRCLRSDPGTSTMVTILLTASTDPLNVENGIGLGASDYILKPFGHIDLIRKLKPFLRNQHA